jgi:hypothetical protein
MNKHLWFCSWFCSVFVHGGKHFFTLVVCFTVLHVCCSCRLLTWYNEARSTYVRPSVHLSPSLSLFLKKKEAPPSLSLCAPRDRHLVDARVHADSSQLGSHATEERVIVYQHGTRTHATRDGMYRPVWPAALVQLDLQEY